MPSLVQRLTVVELLLAIFFKNVRKLSRRKEVSSTLTDFKLLELVMS